MLNRWTCLRKENALLLIFVFLYSLLLILYSLPSTKSFNLPSAFSQCRLTISR
jgi:hypothetical protein